MAVDRLGICSPWLATCDVNLFSWRFTNLQHVFELGDLLASETDLWSQTITFLVQRVDGVLLYSDRRQVALYSGAIQRRRIKNRILN